MKFPIIYAAFGLLATGILFQSCQKDNTTTTPPTTTIKNYNDHVQSIVYNHCTTCHSGVAPQGGLDLTTYQNVRNSAENGTLLQRINDSANPMPPSGLLPDANRQAFADWAQSGYPEQ